MTATAGLAGVVASHGKALWYLTRATGVVALVLLTASIVLGVVASVGWTGERWPRFLSQAVHRNVSLLCLVFVGVHVVSTISDGFVPIGFLDAVLPFRSPYRPLWVGLGAVALDLMVAVAVTSGLRRRIGYDAWRFVHWLSYLCWPVAMLHSLGSGTDTPLGIVLFVDTLCAGVVLAALVWRMATARELGAGWRVGSTLTAGIAVLVIGLVAVEGPLRPGWSHRSGTSPALLSRLAAEAAGGSAGTSTTSPAATAGGGTPSSGALPAAPFTAAVTGTQSSSAPDAQGDVVVTLSLTTQDAASTPLTIVLRGPAVAGGGVQLSSGSVVFGGERGVVTGLDGPSIQATLSGPEPLAIVVQLQADPSSGTLTGSVTGQRR